MEGQMKITKESSAMEGEMKMLKVSSAMEGEMKMLKVSSAMEGEMKTPKVSSAMEGEMKTPKVSGAMEGEMKITKKSSAMEDEMEVYEVSSAKEDEMKQSQKSSVEEDKIEQSQKSSVEEVKVEPSAGPSAKKNVKKAKRSSDEIELPQKLKDLSAKYSEIRLQQLRRGLKRECVRYSKEYKEHIIGLWIQGYSFTKIGKDLGLTESTVRTWVTSKFGTNKLQCHLLRKRFDSLVKKKGMVPEAAAQVLLNSSIQVESTRRKGRIKKPESPEKSSDEEEPGDKKPEMIAPQNIVVTMTAVRTEEPLASCSYSTSQFGEWVQKEKDTES